MPTGETLIKSSEKLHAKEFPICIHVSWSFPTECATLSKGNSPYECKALPVLEQCSSLDNIISFYFITDKNTTAPIIFPIFQKFPAVIDEPRVKLKMRLFVFKEMVKHCFKI